MQPGAISMGTVYLSCDEGGVQQLAVIEFWQGFLGHVMGCTHERLEDCPEYREHLRQLTEDIVAGSYRRAGHPRFRFSPASHPEWD